MKKLLIILILSAGTLIPAHAVWDKTTPSGTESKSLGDDRIREFKSDVEKALKHEGDFPGSDTSNPKYTWHPSTGTTGQRPTGGDRPVGKVFINKSSSTVEQWNGTSWDVIATLIPTGTVMPFFQSACPVGWTEITTQNDKALRVVSGAGGGTGGTHPLSTPPSTAHTHTITINSAGAHAHNLHNHSGPGTGAASASIGWSAVEGGDALVATTAGGFTDYYTLDRFTDSAGAHTHTGVIDSSSTVAYAPQYIDIIMCSKD